MGALYDTWVTSIKLLKNNSAERIDKITISVGTSTSHSQQLTVQDRKSAKA